MGVTAISVTMITLRKVQEQNNNVLIKPTLALKLEKQKKYSIESPKSFFKAPSNFSHFGYHLHPKL